MANKEDLSSNLDAKTVATNELFNENEERKNDFDIDILNIYE